LDDAFLSATPNDDVLFEVAATKTWLRQVIVGLTLICRGSYRGVVEFLRDLLGVSISVGTVHHVLEWATQQAGIVNHDQDLSGIRVGLHDELFQGAMPVLAGGRCDIDLLLSPGRGGASRCRYVGRASARCHQAGAET
jgi:hypothetical protein